MENENKVICTKCGGELLPDQEGKIYRCMYCGVAFGSTVLFNKDAHIKAHKALVIGEYNEADVWYSCMLMRDPGNVYALRGRVLCAGKWKRPADINTALKMSDIRFNNLYERIAEGAARTEGDYKEYFVSFNKLVNLLAQIQGKTFELRSVGEGDAAAYNKGMLSTELETVRKFLNGTEIKLGLDKTPDPEG